MKPVLMSWVLPLALPVRMRTFTRTSLIVVRAGSSSMDRSLSAVLDMVSSRVGTGRRAERRTPAPAGPLLLPTRARPEPATSSFAGDGIAGNGGVHVFRTRLIPYWHCGDRNVHQVRTRS